MVLTFWHSTTTQIVVWLVILVDLTNSLHNAPKCTSISTRRTFLSQVPLVVVVAQQGLLPSFAADGADSLISIDGSSSSSDSNLNLGGQSGVADGSGGVTVFKLKSGLQYIDLTMGSGVSPEYGQLCSIKYTAYLKLPNDAPKSPLQRFDSDSYLLKHGNGRLIAGLDEGIHTMKVGGRRRLLIPPKLGFVEDALGPVPQSPFDQLRLNRLLQKMVEQRGGKLIYDVELMQVIDDEADQGYYQDLSLTEEQFLTLRDNIQAKAKLDRGI